MRETIIKCDLCLKDITAEESIPLIKLKTKPKNGWRSDGNDYMSTNAFHELCSTCETKIFETVINLRVKGSPVRFNKKGKVIEDED